MIFIRKIIEKGMFFGAKSEVFDLALRMRKNPTEAEKAMWIVLREFRKKGFLFRRQRPIEFYIADFYCHRARLVIEVDGEIHSEQDIIDHDDSRTGEMERLGIRVIRFTNEQNLNHSDFVRKEIEETVNNLKQSLTSSPSLPGGGGQGER